ncbi:hypothetical protein NMY22_g1239 [Coprinellus aureogranulatus]|nr:hypothetical protein NMY22_g1239 [Coprinellus aureogranulatus]
MPGGSCKIGSGLDDIRSFNTYKPKMAHLHALNRPQVSRGFSAPALHSALSNHATNTPSSSSSSSSTSSTNSYFSAQAPSTGVSPAISPATPYTTGLSPASPMTSDYPIITATVTSRNQTSISSSTNNSMSARDDPLRQFALHIPAPPTLSLSAATRQPAPSVQTPMHAANNTSSKTASSSNSHRGYDDLPSPMDRSRRMPSSNHAPQMTVASSVYFYTLSVQLPTAIQPEMVTVCANKGDKLKVVADAWHMENESHYEWQITFPPRDVDMSAVHARFDDSKNLTIDVRRLPRVYRF